MNLWKFHWIIIIGFWGVKDGRYRQNSWILQYSGLVKWTRAILQTIAHTISRVNLTSESNSCCTQLYINEDSSIYFSIQKFPLHFSDFKHKCIVYLVLTISVHVLTYLRYITFANSNISQASCKFETSSGSSSFCTKITQYVFNKFK